MMILTFVVTKHFEGGYGKSWVLESMDSVFGTGNGKPSKDVSPSNFANSCCNLIIQSKLKKQIQTNQIII
jgi:hypothetical protein